MLFLGLIFYTGMAVWQVLSAFFRIVRARRQTSKYCIGLKRYLVLVVFYFGILKIFGDNVPSFIIGPYLFIIPWIFSIWYVIFNVKWRRKLKHIKEFDKMQLLNRPHPDRLKLESLYSHKVSPKLSSKFALEKILQVDEIAK